jgi:hypothetical protein
MKREWKIFLIILTVLIVIILILVAITLYQLKQIATLASDVSLHQDFQALVEGDCLKLPAVEAKVASIQSTLKTSCVNPVVKMIISKNTLSGRDLCQEASNPNSETMEVLIRARSLCSNKS